jgi:hypothetical protein
MTIHIPSSSASELQFLHLSKDEEATTFTGFTEQSSDVNDRIDHPYHPAVIILGLGSFIS